MSETQVCVHADAKLAALTKAELAERLFTIIGLNKGQAREIVDTFFQEILRALEQGRRVRLAGFGNFQLRDKPKRPGRNPKTGEAIPIAARRVVTFRASLKLKGALADQTEPVAGSQVHIERHVSTHP